MVKSVSKKDPKNGSVQKYYYSMVCFYLDELLEVFFIFISAFSEDADKATTHARSQMEQQSQKQSQVAQTLKWWGENL